MGCSGVLCLKAGDAWFAAHRVELPVLKGTKEISMQKRNVWSWCSLWISMELRREQGMGISSSYLGFLLW